MIGLTVRVPFSWQFSINMRLSSLSFISVSRLDLSLCRASMTPRDLRFCDSAHRTPVAIHLPRPLVSLSAAQQ